MCISAKEVIVPRWGIVRENRRLCRPGRDIKWLWISANLQLLEQLIALIVGQDLSRPPRNRHSENLAPAWRWPLWSDDIMAFKPFLCGTESKGKFHRILPEVVHYRVEISSFGRTPAQLWPRRWHLATGSRSRQSCYEFGDKTNRVFGFRLETSHRRDLH